MILDKLIKDGYVSFEKFNGFAGTSIADSNEYLITFEGAVFYESAGYTGKLKNERAITRKLRIESMLLTYGTLGAGLYGVFEIAKWALHHFHRHLPF
jgi:hypothetical protein